MEPPPQTQAAHRRPLILSAAALVLSGLVSIWALAEPGEDLIGDVLAAAGDAGRSYIDWLGTGPARGTLDIGSDTPRMPAGDAEEGARLIARSGCGACHVIPGIAGADGSVGPGLAGFADRAYIAGILPNKGTELIAWLRDPPALAPETAMPAMGVTREQAEHMAAYLYRLRGAP